MIRKILNSIRSPEQAFRARLIEIAWREWRSPKTGDQYSRENGGRAGQDWCGDFFAICAREAGVDLKIARHILPSTYRLASMDYADSFYAAHGLDPLKKIDKSAILPGHVVVVKTTRGQAWGDHIVMPVEVRGDRLVCIEGNAHGLLPAGSWSPSRSVVLQVRAFNDVVCAYEITRAHLR